MNNLALGQRMECTSRADYVKGKVKKQYNIKNNKINRCGKSTSLLYDSSEGQYFYKQYRCTQLACDSCRMQAHDNLKTKVLHSVYTYNLRNFLTLTIDSNDYYSLSSSFDDLNKRLSLLNRDKYIRDYRSRRTNSTYERASSAYTSFINKIVQYEVYKLFFLRYHSSICISLASSEGVHYTSLKDRRPFIQSHKKAIDKKINEYITNFKHGKSKFEYHEIGEYDNYSSFVASLREKILKNTDIKYSYIRVLEYQKNGYPHFHVLLNYYPAYYFLDNYFSGHIVKNKDLYDGQRDLEVDTLKASASAVSGYITKYITKETITNLDKTGDRLRVITSSKHIDTGLFTDFEKTKSGYKHLGTFNYIPPSNFGVLSVADSSSAKEYIKHVFKPSSDSWTHPIIRDLTSKYKDLEKQIKQNVGTPDFRSKKKELYERFYDYKSEQETLFLKSEIDKFSESTSVSIPRSAFASLNFDTVEQRSFADSLCNPYNNVICLTGAAGTGKTTLLSQILPLIPSSLNVEFTAFTGKAVARLNGVIGSNKGKTIHRLCSARYSYLPNFLKNSANMLDADIVFIDEASMLDKLTFSMLLNAINPAAKVVLIGDDNQLNPVKSNSILEEIRLSGSRRVSFCNLTKNYRSGDNIIDMANVVLSGSGSTLPFEPININEIYKLKESGYQILANSNPMVEKINTYFSKTKKDVTATAFYNYNFGDDVLICRNNSAKGLYNGDVVTLDRVDNDKLVFRQYDSSAINFLKNECSVCAVSDFHYGVFRSFGLKRLFYRSIFYDVFKSSREFQPADCITVHKSQGSEYDKVALVLDDKNFLLNKNILYTAITRAKSDIRLFYKSGGDLSLLDVPQVSGDSYTLANIAIPDRP